MWTRPTDGGLRAESICAACPVRQQCLEWVLGQPQIARAGMVAGGHLWTAKGKPTKRHPRKPCRLCGREFQPLRKRDAFCGRCKIGTGPQVANGSCHGCGKPVPQSRTGPRRIWCSNACTCRAYYARNRNNEIARKRRERGAA